MTRRWAFELGATVAEADPADALRLLCAGVCNALDADWAVVISAQAELHRVGDPPGVEWLWAFLEGSDHLGDDHVGPGDVIWARLPGCRLAVVAGRSARAAHERVRARLRPGPHRRSRPAPSLCRQHDERALGPTG